MRNNIRDKNIERAIKKGINAVRKMARQEPCIILEMGAGPQPEALKELGAWLFRRKS